MQIDPTRWMVSYAGFIYDWIITREGRRLGISALPILLLTVFGGVAWYGSRLDNRKLAAWYLELGEEEIAQWEMAWAPGGDVDSGDASKENGELTVDDISLDKQTSSGLASGEASDDAPLDSNADESQPAMGNSTSEAKPSDDISRFAEILFRRVQLLQPSDRSQFVIGATLAQRGAFDQAIRVLSKIAPENRSGYAPAHAYLAMIYLRQFKQERSAELLPALKHHTEMASRWSNAPEEILIAGSQLHWASRDVDSSLRMLDQAAERNPRLWVDVTKRARAAGNKRRYEQSRANAERHLIGRLKQDPTDAVARVQLAELLAIHEEGLDKAEQLLREGRQLEANQLLDRGLSEIYRLRFHQTVTQQGDRFMADVTMLDKAINLDPANPRIAEEIAKLGRLNGSLPDNEMRDTLQEFLAEGKATTATHAWLSEIYLMNEQYAESLPHLEQLALRLPNGSQYLNNLAWVLSELHPERLDEALQYAQRAVTAARNANSPNAYFYDTLGRIYAQIGESQKAIAAYESAIELEPTEIKFHESIAEQHRLGGNESMAATHERVIEKIRQQQSQQPQPEQPAGTPIESSTSSAGETDAATPIASQLGAREPAEQEAKGDEADRAQADR